VFVASIGSVYSKLLAGFPKYITDRPQRILYAAVRLISGTCKLGRDLSSLLHNYLQWLDVPDHISVKLNVTAQRCLQEKDPKYLNRVSEVAGRRQLRSVSRQHLTVTRNRLCTLGRFQVFSVAGPTSWNSSPDRLRDPTLNSNSIRKLLKTKLFAS